MSPKKHPTPEYEELKAVGKYLTAFQRKLLQVNLLQELTDKKRQRKVIMLLYFRWS